MTKDRKRDDATPPEPAGQVVHDDRGQAVWQPNTDYSTEDTLHERLKTEQLALLEGGTGFDPYGHETLEQKPADASRRRTDLRALSAQILAERAKKSSGT